MTLKARTTRAAIITAMLAWLWLPATAFSQHGNSALTTDALSQLPDDRAGRVLIYGAYGFTGRGISQLADDYGIRPVLAGRNLVAGDQQHYDGDGRDQ